MDCKDGGEGLPVAFPVEQTNRTRLARRRHHLFIALLVGTTTFATLQYSSYSFALHKHRAAEVYVPINAEAILQTCRALEIKPGPPLSFRQRTASDRFVEGTKPTLIKNATLWTGRVDGLEQYSGDILLDSGLIKGIGKVDPALLASLDDVVAIDANGAWVTPGIVDLHSHIGVQSSPAFQGANDGNSRKGPILPWLRALDALNTHNDAYKLSVAGGVTTGLVLPGSANAIGGQGILIKYRPTASRSPTGLLLENPYSTNITEYDPSVAFRFRQMKHACGENPDRVYSGTRMDTTWAFRQAYDKARQIKNAQDSYCSKALAGQWTSLGEFPEDYQWEALVDVLRGRVKVHTHCYETVDLDDLVRITNEFKFPIAAFHHAHETYLVSDTLKAAYGHPPAAALFATNARYKRESYRGSEYAPKILAENGIQVIMKSDHPVLDSRYLLYEAQQAHYYGLPGHLALASVISTPAQVLGQDHRIGYLKSGYDADVVLWDSHPLTLGATPQQVWIDGIEQLKPSYAKLKPGLLQRSPKTPNFDEEADATLEYDGLPPLQPKHSKEGVVVFRNFTRVFVREDKQIQEATAVRGDAVVVDAGKIVCRGPELACSSSLDNKDVTYVDLQGGTISPGLVSYGSPLGLQEIQAEVSTADGTAYDPLRDEIPEILGGQGSIVRAVDGLEYVTRNALLAYRSGVTTAVTPPRTGGFLAGLSTAFSTGAEHKLKRGALVQDAVALHVVVRRMGTPSVSSQIATLRNLLSRKVEGPLGAWADKVAQGQIPLVVEVHSADAMASIIRLKADIESTSGHRMKVTFAGASEAHLLAAEISTAQIGVIVSPSRAFPYSWDHRRILPGPPLSEENAISTLLANNVTVAVGVREGWEARNTRFDIAWAALDARGSISRSQAIALATVNLEELLGVTADDLRSDLVATRGGDFFSFEGKVVAVISPRRGVVDFV